MALVGLLVLLWMGPTQSSADAAGDEASETALPATTATYPAEGSRAPAGAKVSPETHNAEPDAAAAPLDEPSGAGLTEAPTGETSDSAVAEAPLHEGAESDTQTPGRAVEQATGTIRDVLRQAYGLLPKLAIGLAIMILGWVLSRLIRMIMYRSLRSWHRAEAISALSRITVFMLALGLALTIIAGDSRALVGSVGLAGLALSWALQAPIESFTGWLLNSFQGYYRVGDRIAVGEVFGDVYRIDVLTTMVWEAGGPGKPVQGAQPTGALITFPNSEVLRNNIVNYTRDFPHVWDEVTFGIANESDLALAAQVIRDVSSRLLGPVMQGPAREYRRLLHRTEHLGLDIATEPQVYASLADSWTNMTVRYLVPARERRKWSSQLILAVSAELADPQYKGRITSAYPHTRIEML